MFLDFEKHGEYSATNRQQTPSPLAQTLAHSLLGSQGGACGMDDHRGPMADDGAAGDPGHRLQSPADTADDAALRPAVEG